MENKNEENDKKEDKKEEKKEEKKDGKDQKEEKDDNEIEKDKKYKKNKRRNFSPHNIDNKQDSKTFMDNLKIFDKNFKEKVPNINNRPVNSNINQIRNTEDDFTMNINETPLIDPYPNLDTNPFRQNGDYLNLAQNQEQINLLRIIADNLRNGENQRGISYSIILIGYIFCFVFLTNHFRNHGGFNYSASISLYCMVVALSCLISVIYLKEIRKANKNK